MCEKFEKVVALAISLALLLTIALQVVDRYLFGGSLQLGWTEEIARLLLLWLTFWGAVLVQRDDTHIRLEVVLHRLPSVAQTHIYIIIDVAILIFLVVVVTQGVPYARHEMALALPATGLPRSVFVLAVVVGSFLMSVYVVRNLLKRIQRLRSSK